MRKLSMVMSVLAVALSASLAHAGTYSFGLKGGVAIPTGDLGDAFNAAPAGGVFADYWMSPQMGFGADIAGDFFKNSDFPDPNPLVLTTHDETFDVIQFGVHGMYGFGAQGASLSPFIQYGIAMYNLKSEVKDFNAKDTSTKFGFNGGLGLNFGGSETMKIGVGAEYHYITTEKDPSTGSSSATYFRLLARLTFLTAATTQ
jgi:opacity protein-like surface antigen